MQSLSRLFHLTIIAYFAILVVWTSRFVSRRAAGRHIDHLDDAVTSDPSTSPLDNEATIHDRRYLSIMTSAERKKAIKDGRKLGGAGKTWPKTDHLGEKLSVVSLCFATEEGYKQLWPLIKAGIENWTPAIFDPAGTRQASLVFAPDRACNGDYHCICASPGWDPHSVQILKFSDTSSTVGYHVTKSNVLRIEKSEDWNPDDRTNTAEFGYWERVMATTHELGHIIGLGHEHQRPNSQSLSGNEPDVPLLVEIKNLSGYNDLIKEVSGPEFIATIRTDFPKMTPDFEKHMASSSPEERMMIIWETPKLRAKYIPIASDLASIPELDPRGWIDGRRHDYLSIMHYSSWFPPGHDPLPFSPDPIAWMYDNRPPEKASSNKDHPYVFMGGNPNYELVAISPGDMARVRKLYPLQRPATDEVSSSVRRTSGDDPVFKPMRVQLSCSLEPRDVRPAPAYKPIFPGTPEEATLFKQHPRGLYLEETVDLEDNDALAEIDWVASLTLLEKHKSGVPENVEGS
ncbi:hypothetical protein B0A48_17295 [Cryoendolithus antarcticus]|uniref:Peptidase metallopeptidase domain-containing protein n=1 Tax=Cryoendolithus antarcticus TaxID=1507870 RepID=A0A1V8SBU8_9PEZI|nr:hypothetical protein B0A48_17295 [Cryoendolithus antarcticus]